MGGKTGQNKHKQKVRGKRDRYHRLTPFSSTPGLYADMPCKWSGQIIVLTQSFTAGCPIHSCNRGEVHEGKELICHN